MSAPDLSGLPPDIRVRVLADTHWSGKPQMQKALHDAANDMNQRRLQRERTEENRHAEIDAYYDKLEAIFAAGVLLIVVVFVLSLAFFV
jgi:acyl carrier protein phosphodiesterase